MTIEEISKMEEDLATMKAELVEYDRLYRADGHVDTNEQCRLDYMQKKITILRDHLEGKRADLVYRQSDTCSLSGNDPIERTISQWYNKQWVDYFKMISTVSFKVYDRTSGKLVDNSIKDEELNKSTEEFTLYANSKIIVQLWSKAEIANVGELWGFDTQEILTKEYEFVILTDTQGNIESSKLQRNVRTGLQGDPLYKYLDINISVQVNASTKSLVIDGSIVLPATTISNAKEGGQWTFEGGGKAGNENTGEVGGSVGYQSGKSSTSITYSFAKAEITPVTRRIALNFKAPAVNPKQGGTIGKVWFGFNEYQLSNTAMSAIDTAWRREIKKYPEDQLERAFTSGKYTIIVYGYADKTGSNQYNQSLGAKRAESVVNYIKKSIPGSSRYPDNFNTASYGESQSSGENVASDRKAIIKFYLKEKVNYKKFLLK